MSRVAALAYLAGEGLPGLTAVTWIPRDARSIVDVASASGADLAFVDADEGAGVTVEALHDVDVAVALVVDGPLGRATRRFGLAGLLSLSARDADGALALVRAELPAVEADVRAAAAVDADAVVVADDVAAENGWLFAPAFVHALCGEWAVLGHAATAVGLPAVFHSDGDVAEMYPRLAATGFGAVHLALPAAADLAGTVRFASQHGLMAIGGLSGRDPAEPRRLEVVSQLVSEGLLMGADDGGVADAEGVAALISALRSLRLE